jgi:hypothetical protein
MRAGRYTWREIFDLHEKFLVTEKKTDKVRIKKKDRETKSWNKQKKKRNMPPKKSSSKGKGKGLNLDDDEDEKTFVLILTEETFEITKREASLSEHLTVVLESEGIEGEPDNERTLAPKGTHMVKNGTFARVIKYLKKHNGVPPPEIEVPLPSFNMSNVVSDWDAEFIEKVFEEGGMESLSELVLAALYFKIRPLETLGCAKIATLMKKCETTDEMRKVLGIKITPEEVKKHEKTMNETYNWMK